MTITKGKMYKTKYFLIILLFFLFLLSFKLFLYKENSKSLCLINNNTYIKFNTGLLLGFKKNIDKDTVTYRTLWITPDEKNNLKIIGKINSIIVPHGNTFWKIEPIRYNYTNTNDFTQYLISHKISNDYSPKIFKYKFSTYNCTLNFVDKDYVSVSTYKNYHGQEVKDYTQRSCSVIKLEKLSDFNPIKSEITMSDIFKSKALPIINKYKNSRILLGECSEDNPVNTTSGDEWNIGRNNGKWVPQIAKTFKFSGNSSDYILYNTSLELPKSIVSFNDLCTSINSIKKIIPETEDTISSPNRDIIGILTPNKLTLYPYSNDSIGSPSLTIDLDRGETMIMVQWADTNEIKDWTQILNQYFTLK